MAYVKCETCGGIYQDVMPDGIRYFHACPPVVDPRTGKMSARPNARNENVIAVGANQGQPLAHGKGVSMPSAKEIADAGGPDVAAIAPQPAPVDLAPATTPAADAAAADLPTAAEKPAAQAEPSAENKTEPPA